MLPVLFRVGPVEVYSYTVCLLTAFIVVGWLAYHEAKRRLRLNEDTLMVGSAGLIGAVLGSKLGMLVFLGRLNSGGCYRLSHPMAQHCSAG